MRAAQTPKHQLATDGYTSSFQYVSSVRGEERKQGAALQLTHDSQQDSQTSAHTPQFPPKGSRERPLMCFASVHHSSGVALLSELQQSQQHFILLPPILILNPPKTSRFPLLCAQQDVLFISNDFVGDVMAKPMCHLTVSDFHWPGAGD